MQQVFIIIFSALTIQVLLDIRLRGSVDSHAKATTLLSAVLAVLALITVSLINAANYVQADLPPLGPHHLPHC